MNKTNLLVNGFLLSSLTIATVAAPYTTKKNTFINNCQIPNVDIEQEPFEPITVEELFKMQQSVNEGSLRSASDLYNVLDIKFPNMAICWLTLAAEKGVSYDQNDLAENYEKGRYVDQDIDRAIYWYTQAAQNERPLISAQLSLANIYAQGKLVPRNVAKAFYWYQIAARDNNSDSSLYGEATFKLGYAYHYGIGVAKNEDKALLAYNKAIDSTSRMDSSHAYANMYETGLGVRKNLKKAADYYYYAAIEGDKSAQFKMNELYREGKGVPQDIDMADGWLEISQLTPEQLSVSIYE